MIIILVTEYKNSSVLFYVLEQRTLFHQLDMFCTSLLAYHECYVVFYFALYINVAYNHFVPM